ncbi:uncharacterized protein LOC130767054 isoform X2 [Actinidia eriantha]|uniref:uncharacterized protein LOC130767054 isoform X2 n=1 Tax=Actinidia eriantha TaxID=165200 RepID=UPI0025833105|nr:uncharacterized protein LOC130767054 isoform X2 [Actinidia eriantha]
MLGFYIFSIAASPVGFSLTPLSSSSAQTIKTMKNLITDMHFDLLKYIMILMVKSSEGATSLARAVSVCSVFMKAAEDTDILKAVSFDNVSVTYRYELFQQTNGLLFRCAQVGNEAARYLLSKIVLVSSSQLLPRIMKSEPKHTLRGHRCAMYEERHIKIPRDDAMAAAFMPHFLPDQACSTRGPGQTGLLHWELVRKFLCQCTTLDFTEMHPHLNHYIDYFTEQGSRCNLILHYVINKMCHHAYRVRASEEVSLEQVRLVRERFREKIQYFRDRRQSRQRNQVGVIPEADVEQGFALADFTERQFYLQLNSSAVYNLYACMGDFESDIWDVGSKFEECRINAIACFDHVFP